MPWSDQGEPPHRSNDPWGKGPGPWGSGPGEGPPDLEEFLRRSQEGLKQVLPSGVGGRGVAILVLLTLIAWLSSGFYTVGPNEIGLNLIFGKYRGKTQAGLNYNLPSPIGSVIKLPVTDRNAIDIGFREEGAAPRRRSAQAPEAPEESLMLTGDENIVDVSFSVLWKVKPSGVGDFLFNVQSPADTVKAVAESAMREVIGRSNIQTVLTSARQTIETAVQELMQKILDGYQAGILIQQVQLQKVDPPTQVIDSFRDVQAARSDLERAQNEAQTYANRVVPEARGRAAKINQDAEAYREQTVADAKGQTSRFLQVYDQYKKAPDVTRQRMYLETMERVLGGTDKTIIDNGQNGPGVVPYLPLSEVNRPHPAPAAPAGSPATTGGSQ